MGDFAEDALRGGVFVDAQASAPYAFHLALVRVVRRADPDLPALSRPEVVESRLVGLRQNGHVEECPGSSSSCSVVGPAYQPPPATRPPPSPLTSISAEAYARDLGRALAETHRTDLEKSVAERQALLRAGYEYEELDLVDARQRFRERANAGDPKAEEELGKIGDSARRASSPVATRRWPCWRQPELLDIGSVELLAHALVVPSSDPDDQRRQNAEIEEPAMTVVTCPRRGGGRARD